jgi:hypothetical protein
MNSSHAAYNEAEEIRRAIEESKLENSVARSSENGRTRGKRGRDDSEEE